MKFLQLSFFVLLVIVSLCGPAYSGMFENARSSIPTAAGHADLSGVSVRGGAGLQTGVAQGSLTLFRGGATIGGGCGAFNFAASLTEAVKEIPDLMQGLANELVSQLPMLVLCYSDPTVCDIAKHLQSLLNATIQARYAQCQAVQNAAMYGGMRLRGGTISQCLEDEANAGHSISEALRTCNGDPSSIRSPSGANGTNVNLVQETMDTAGASPEMQTLARSLLGEVRLTAGNGRLGLGQDRPQGAALARYEANRGEAEAAIRAALVELQTTGSVTETTLQNASVPGQPIPRIALEALSAVQNDPIRFQTFLQKLSTGIAMTHLAWDCVELQQQLAGAIEANHHLTDEERRLLERRLAGFQADIQGVRLLKDAVDKDLQPAYDALVQAYNEVKSTAVRAGYSAPRKTLPAMPFGRQTPMGYGQ